MPIRGTFNSGFLRRMDSDSTTNRKGFLKRAGLTLLGLLAVSSFTRTGRSGAQSSNRAPGASGPASRGIPQSALARIRTGKGAVARKA